ncbi:MAG: hypothetical protein QS721_12105 [Candidatus Endonucleobacter sp. (ex Gigantidas childressi)]|nr:hypothetical protein [Candidatus Endonucleobacter sp. (ex Gigantidas childressi)]
MKFNILSNVVSAIRSASKIENKAEYVGKLGNQFLKFLGRSVKKIIPSKLFTMDPKKTGDKKVSAKDWKITPKKDDTFESNRSLRSTENREEKYSPPESTPATKRASGKVVVQSKEEASIKPNVLLEVVDGSRKVIAEACGRFSSINDNEWVDALEQLTEAGMDDEKACRCLNDLIIIANDSTEKTKTKLSGNKKLCDKLAQHGGSKKDIVYKEIFKSSLEDSNDSTLELKDRYIETESMSNVLSKYDLHVGDDVDIVKNYFVRLQATLMELKLIHPPLQLEFLNEKEKIPKANFREYLISGKTALYTVWPAVIQVVDGKKELNVKGVVQPAPEGDKIKKPKKTAEKTVTQSMDKHSKTKETKQVDPPTHTENITNPNMIDLVDMALAEAVEIKIKKTKDDIKNNIVSSDSEPTHNNPYHLSTLSVEAAQRLRENAKFTYGTGVGNALDVCNNNIDRLFTSIPDSGKNQSKEDTLRAEFNGIKRQLESGPTFETYVELKVLNDKLVNALSVQAGKLLTQNNSAITDLNDQARPMKISEVFAGIYDNEWTDLLDELTEGTTQFTETTFIEMINEYVLNSFHSWGERVDALQSSTQLENARDNSTRQSLKNILFDFSEGSKAFGIKDKFRDQQVLQDMMKKYKLEHSKVLDDFDNILNTCMAGMLCQEPPMHIKFPAIGEKLDTEITKTFTQSGNVIEYPVWPAVYLEENGALISKGVAQPIKD